LEPAGVGEDALVQGIEQIERFNEKVEPKCGGEVKVAAQAGIGRTVCWSDQCIAPEARKTVVEAIIVLVGVACDFGVVRSAAAYGDHPGKLPMIEQDCQGLISGDGIGFGDHGEDKPVALVGDARTLLRLCSVRVLYRGGLAGYECIRAVVDGVGPGVAQAEVQAIGQAALQGDGEAVVLAGGLGLELVDGAELGNRPRQRVDAGGARASKTLCELPGRESSDLRITEKVDAGGIEDGILDLSGRGQVHVSRANEVEAVSMQE